MKGTRTPPQRILFFLPSVCCHILFCFSSQLHFFLCLLAGPAGSPWPWLLGLSLLRPVLLVYELSTLWPRNEKGSEKASSPRTNRLPLTSHICRAGIRQAYSRPDVYQIAQGAVRMQLLGLRNQRL